MRWRNNREEERSLISSTRTGGSSRNAATYLGFSSFTQKLKTLNCCLHESMALGVKWVCYDANLTGFDDFILGNTRFFSDRHFKKHRNIEWKPKLVVYHLIPLVYIHFYSTLNKVETLEMFDVRVIWGYFRTPEEKPGCGYSEEHQKVITRILLSTAVANRGAKAPNIAEWFVEVIFTVRMYVAWKKLLKSLLEQFARSIISSRRLSMILISYLNNCNVQNCLLM